MDHTFRKSVLLSSEIHRSLSREECYLFRPGFDVRSGRSSGEILDLAARLPPDAVLIDYALPERKGLDVCRALKAAGRGASPPVLILGPADPAAKTACLNAGCDEYIEVPASPNRLLQLLASFLGIQFRLHTRVAAVLSIAFGRIVSEFLGYSKDISEGGILVESTTRMETGRRLQLRLYLEDSDRPLRLPATVLRVEPGADEDRYLIGMQFLSPPTEIAEQIRTFIRRRAEPC
ncbi:MAG: PilZ domain-containing protein [Candidatus Polarisedimenticolia bacterium]